jgi:hypothetical protein
MRLCELQQLIDDLVEDGLDTNTEVIFGGQPNYPFGYSIGGYCLDHTFEYSFSRGREQQRTVLVLTEKAQLAYGHKEWWDCPEIHPGCEHEWEEVEGEPPHDVCINCGETRF